VKLYWLKDVCLVVTLNSLHFRLEDQQQQCYRCVKVGLYPQYLCVYFAVRDCPFENVYSVGEHVFLLLNLHPGEVNCTEIKHCFLSWESYIFLLARIKTY
jgi:hypothetical protein